VPVGSTAAGVAGFGTAGEIIRSTRGLRAAWAAGAVSVADGALTGGFAVNRDSAAWRALAVCSRSSPGGRGGCCRLSKSCSEGLISFGIIEGRFGKLGKPDLGSRGAIRKLASLPTMPCRARSPITCSSGKCGPNVQMSVPSNLKMSVSLALWRAVGGDFGGGAERERWRVAASRGVAGRRTAGAGRALRCAGGSAPARRPTLSALTFLNWRKH
jgi:hypothetical protein